MEQGKLYVIEEKTYEAHINEEVHLYGLLHQLPFFSGRLRTTGTSPVATWCSATKPTLPG